VRPLFYDFPDDSAAVDIDDAFMLGPDLLVAPVLEEGASDRQVYLPDHPGGWFDFHDGRHFAGGQAVTVPAPFGRLPVFVRCGAMIPVTTQTDRIDPGTDVRRELIVFGAPSDEAHAYLYEDDGDTADWNGDHRLELRFELRRVQGEFVLSIESAGRYRPAVDAIAIRPVAIDAQIRLPTPQGSVRVVQGEPGIQR
jgi:alpha-glucosidase